MTALYDTIGVTYRVTRQQDDRIAAAIAKALGDARTVVNVGAGTGSYEPTERDVLAVEPSATMIAQRASGAAPALQASAEALPLANQSYDAVLAVNTIQHWADLRAGLRECKRVARRRIVIFLRHAPAGAPFWLTEDYFPSLDRSARSGASLEIVYEELPSVQSIPVPLPHDCADGMFSAYWARPEQYLDENIRKNISNFALASVEEITRGLARLRADLESSAWERKYAHLRSLAELDLGHRLLVAESPFDNKYM